MIFNMPEEKNPFITVAHDLHQKWLALAQAKRDFDDAVGSVRDCIKTLTINQRHSGEVIVATQIPRDEYVRLTKKDMLMQLADKLEKEGFIRFDERALPDNKGLEYEMSISACKKGWL